MYILGISSYYHDSAVALIKNGKVIVALEEERFTRKKHDNSFPENAIQHCLKYAGIDINDVDYVSYYEKPLLKFERIIDTFVDTYPRSWKIFLKGIPEWFTEKIKVGSVIKKITGYQGKIYYVPHHLSHASVAYYPSFFKKSAILTIDGAGDWPTASLWFGDGIKIHKLEEINFPHSLGLFYSTFTAFLGFRVNHDEYKVMGLAAYGTPRYANLIRERVIKIRNDGSFMLNLDYFAFRDSSKMYSRKFIQEFGRPRKHGEKFFKRDQDLAASLQTVTEEVYFKILNHLYQLTQTENLCLGGGVALNSVANGKIFVNTPFKNIYSFGAAGDSGAAIGSALFTYHSILKNKKRNRIKNLCLGTSYSGGEIEDVLKNRRVKYKKIENEEKLITKAANLLANNKIIGWYQGRMEFGPRALGSRSILVNPRDRRMKEAVNKIKKRENFRPFAGSVLQEKAQDLFDVPERNYYSPFMNFCFTTKPGERKNILAIVHKDNTCRIQTVNKKDNGTYYKLIREFYRLTKIPCVLNTSFNVAGKPIVETPQEAIDVFLSTNMDLLIIGNILITK